MLDILRSIVSLQNWHIYYGFLTLLLEFAVADVLLWENKKVSAALSVGMTVLWLLFEVAEYNFVTLFCHISIAAMLIIFIWFTTADFFNWYIYNYDFAYQQNYITFLITKLQS